MDGRASSNTSYLEEGVFLPPGEETISLGKLVSRTGAPACVLFFHRTGTEPTARQNWTREPIEMTDRVPALISLNAVRKTFGLTHETAHQFLVDILDLLPAP
jgi:hypothetical protein